MSFSIGIVGLPNVGKSTLFQAITRKQVDTSNYPFATIDPNVGVVAVPDERLEALAKLSKSAKVVPTTVEFVDIAGLVKGAAKGEGLGNKFLSHIRGVDAICHVTRAFTDPNVTHVAGRVDPADDEQTIRYELAMADLEQVSRALENAAGKARSGDKDAIKLHALLKRVNAALNEGKLASEVPLDEDERISLKPFNLLTTKPMFTVRNVDETAVDPSAEPLTISAKIEAELAALSPEEARAFMDDLGWSESGLDRLIHRAYRLLNLITFLTTGPKETRAWTVTAGTKAPQAAGVIHSDFETGFIRAEIINWSELLDAGSEEAAKAKGLVRIEGKDYIIQDGDTVFFRVA